MFAHSLRRIGLEVFEEIGRYLSIIRCDSYEMFIDVLLNDISQLLKAERISLLRFNAENQKWSLIASTGIGKMSGTYDLQDISIEEPEDCKWIISPTEGIGNDAIFTFKVPLGEDSYFCAIGVDDDECARDYSTQETDLQRIGNSAREAILLKLRLFHCESKVNYKRVYEDDLTKLPNRRSWEKMVGDIGKNDIGIQFVMIDLDHFKRINDELGHSVGDLALQCFADTLRLIQARYENCYFARFGGEEFSGIIRSTAAQSSDFLRELKEELLKATVIPWPLTFSGGVCEFDGEMDIKKYIDAADFASYASKEHGRNRSMRAFNPVAMKDIVRRSKRETIDLLECKTDFE